MVSADREGVSPRELADRNNALIRDDYVRLGISYDCFTRTTTRNHYRVIAGHVPHALRQGLPHRADDARGVLPRDRPHAARPLHRGDVPDLRLRARRAATSATTAATSSIPVDLIDPRSIIDGSTPEFRETTHLFLDLPAFARAARGVDRGADALAPERPQLRARARARAEAARDDARHRLGRPGPGRGLSGGHEAHLRLVRRRDRLPVGEPSSGRTTRGTPEAWREWWQNPDARHFYFMGKDNIVFHAVIWPSMLLGYGSGGELGAAGRPPAAVQRRRRAST